MIIQLSELPSDYKVLTSYKTIYLWSSDGWIYNTAKKQKYQYVFISPTKFIRVEEAYEQTSYSDVQYSEELEISILENGFIEKGELFTEYCVVLKE